MLSSKAALNDVIGNDTDSSVAVMEPQVRILKDQWKLLLLVIINVIRSCCHVFPYDFSNKILRASSGHSDVSYEGSDYIKAVKIAKGDRVRGEQLLVSISN